MRLKAEKGAENVVSVFFIGAEQPLLDGDEIAVGEARRGLDIGAMLEVRDVDQDFVGGRRDQLQPFAPAVIVDLRAVLKILLRQVEIDTPARAAG